MHYGMPINPSAPDRIPGGSSSGSASVVAAMLVDFAVGTNTGVFYPRTRQLLRYFGIAAHALAVVNNGASALAAQF
jgi:amidase